MYHVLIQRLVPRTLVPSTKQFKSWTKAILTDRLAAAELTIRLVDEPEMIHLNSTYRQKNYATNILSFPSDIPKEMNDNIPLLGDLIICAPIVNQEAIDQRKTNEAHWAHLVIHGILHLLGYDHEIDAEATRMEAEEITALQFLGFPNPYF